jgi:hypothetical protein
VQKLAKKVGLRLTFKSLRRGFGCYYAAPSRRTPCNG